jgi:hypothetical protein
MPTELTWRKAIDKVLGSSSTPLHYHDITERIISEGLRQNLGANAGCYRKCSDIRLYQA